jgi:anaerobic selenocysteine-containing dehydrogenase
MKLIGGSLLGFAIGGAGGAMMKIPKSMEPVLYSGPRKETWKLTGCTKCPGGCSLRIRLIDNFPIQAFGNPNSPINEGGICPMGLASVARLYHPARLTGPVKNVNGKFVPVSYDEAYKILADELKKVVSEKKQDEVFFVSQTESRLRADLYRKFSNETGIKNLIIDSFETGSSLPYMQVTDQTPDFIDFDNCDYLLNFGSKMTEISRNPLYFMRKLNELRSKGRKITAVQYKLTPGIAKSDDWIPVHPSLYGDFALGIAYVLLKDEKYDKTFVEQNFSDFESFKKHVLDNYYPDKVQELTGVSSDKIIQTGRDFSNATSPAAYFDESTIYNSNGTQNALAILTLNALRGFKGFGKVKTNLFSSILKYENELGQNNTFANLKEHLNTGSVRVLMVSVSNFVFNNPDQASLKKQLSSVPFLVSFSSFIDETSVFAQLIIPDHDDFEKVDLLLNDSIGVPSVTVQQPVVNPFYNTTDTGDVLISLMKDLNPDLKLIYGNYSDFVKENAKLIYSDGEGILMDQNKLTAIEKGLRKIGWQTALYASFDDFWDNLLESGGWWNPFSGKESYNPKLNFKQTFNKDIISKNSSYLSLPKNKLNLNIFIKNLDYKGSMSIYTLLVEQFGSNWSVFYDLWAEINPKTAYDLSLKDRTWIVIKTSRGKFPALLVFNPAVIPGSLDVPFGSGHTVLGDKSGINPLVFMDDLPDKLTGKPSFCETLAEVKTGSTKVSFSSAQRKTNKEQLTEIQNRNAYV